MSERVLRPASELTASLLYQYTAEGLVSVSTTYLLSHLIFRSISLPVFFSLFRVGHFQQASPRTSAPRTAMASAISRAAGGLAPHHAASAQPRKSVSACCAHLRRAASHPPPGRIGAQPTTSTAIPCPAASTLSASGPEVGGCGVAPDKRLTLHAVVTEGAGKSCPPAASRGNCTLRALR